MRPLISAWTDLHTRVGVLVVVASVATLAGALEGSRVAVWVAVAIATAGVLSLALDVLGATAAAFVAAAALIGVRRWTGAWGEDGFTLALLETVGILLAAIAASRVGDVLGTAPEESPDAEPAVEPVFGSLGLLDAETGMLRLDEEVDRARAHGRPLTLVLFRIDLRDPDLDPAARTAAQRAVARLLESRVRDMDVPFALTRDKLAAILPETDSSMALERVGAILDGVATGRFASRAEGTERSLADAVDVSVGTARLTASTADANALLDAASVALDHATSHGDAHL